MTDDIPSSRKPFKNAKHQKREKQERSSISKQWIQHKREAKRSAQDNGERKPKVWVIQEDNISTLENFRGLWGCFFKMKFVSPIIFECLKDIS